MSRSGTVSSAPRGPHMLRALIRPTVAVRWSSCGIFYVLTQGLGYGIDDLPRIIPESGCGLTMNSG